MAAAAASRAAAVAVLGSLAEGFHVSVSRLDFSYTRDESSRLNSRTAACRVCLESQKILCMYLEYLAVHTLKKVRYI